MKHFVNRTPWGQCCSAKSFSIQLSFRTQTSIARKLHLREAFRQSNSVRNDNCIEKLLAEQHCPCEVITRVKSPKLNNIGSASVKPFFVHRAPPGEAIEVIKPYLNDIILWYVKNNRQGFLFLRRATEVEAF